MATVGFRFVVRIRQCSPKAATRRRRVGQRPLTVRCGEPRLGTFSRLSPLWRLGLLPANQLSKQPELHGFMRNVTFGCCGRNHVGSNQCHSRIQIQIF